MLSRLLTMVTSLLACAATASLTEQIELISNPIHHATYLPPYSPSSPGDSGRLLIIGDVHGMLKELEHLLKKADFSSACSDRVIFVGDLVNKGPKSAGVVQYAMDINATSVRGNHEDKVLRVWAGAEEARAHAEANGEDGDEAYKAYEDTLGSGKTAALRVAESMTPEQRAWISAFPIALRMGVLPGLGDVAVVHGGMVPGISLEEQEPWAMYNIRALIDFDNDEDEATRSDKFLNTIEERLTDMEPNSKPSQQQLKDAKQAAISRYQQVGYLPTSEFADGKRWVKAWNKHEKAKPKGDRLTLVYGHDSKRNIQMKDYSFGLDSKCVDGGKLTALVLEPRKGGKGKDVTLKHSLVSVKCANKSAS